MSFQSRRLDTNPKGATGPVTDAGKVVSFQNARKHGLNAPPDVALVSQWFNAILNNSVDDLEEPSASDPLREAALRLAIAEARYHRALHKVDTHEREPGSAQQLAMKLRQEIRDVLDGHAKENSRRATGSTRARLRKFCHQATRGVVRADRPRAPPVPPLPRRGAGAAREGPEGVVRLQSRRKPKFPKRTQITISRRICLAPANAPIKQAASNAQGHADDVRYPVVDVGAAVEAGLDEFNGAAEGARADEDGQQPEAARAGQWEGECGEGDEVHQLVAALRRRGRRLQGPEHRDGQGERHR